MISTIIKFFSGVPDSCTNNFCNELSKRKNIISIIMLMHIYTDHNLREKKILIT